jgi:arsenate reductase
MAEAFLNTFFGERFQAESAGLEHGSLNPVALEVMKEAGIDISGNNTKDVIEFFKAWKMFQYVVRVCDEASAERCPVFPGAIQRLHWSFPDPSRLQGSNQEKLEKAREIRDQIRQKIEEWVASLNG